MVQPHNNQSYGFHSMYSRSICCAVPCVTSLATQLWLQFEMNNSTVDHCYRKLIRFSSNPTIMIMFSELCKMGKDPSSVKQTDWYFFSHKDRKYPTGYRANRATAAGFWKATGRDKPVHCTKLGLIGMRKTLVFYTGRAPHGQKTDWIMHEFRLDGTSSPHMQHCVSMS